MTDYLNPKTAEALLMQALHSDELNESDSGPLAAAPRTPKPYNDSGAMADIEFWQAETSEASTPKGTKLK